MGDQSQQNPKGEITENFGKDSEGGPVKFAWKMKIWAGGGSPKSSKVIRGDHFNEVTFKRGIG